MEKHVCYSYGWAPTTDEIIQISQNERFLKNNIKAKKRDKINRIKKNNKNIKEALFIDTAHKITRENNGYRQELADLSLFLFHSSLLV